MDQSPSEPLFQGFLDAAPDAMVVVGTRGEIVSVNKQIENTFGYRREELLGQSIEVLVPKKFRAAHPASREKYFSDPHTRPMGEGRDLLALRKDGTEFPAEISLSPMESSAGAYVIAAVRDVTERKRAEDKFRELLEAAPDAMVIVGVDGRIAIVNAQTEKIFGYSKEELLGEPVETLMPERFRVAHARHRGAFFEVPKVRTMGSGLELFGRRKDGSEFPVQISLSPLQTADGVLVSSAIRDVTHQKKMEENLRKANRLKSEFLANMSHELRTPLNAVIGFASLMHQGKVGPLSADQKEYLGDILSSSRHLLRLINDVLDISKIESGRMEFVAERIHLGTLVEEVRGVVEGLAVQKRILLEVLLDPALGWVILDPSKLKQVLYNYVSNAIKFTPEGGRVQIRVTKARPGMMRLDVEDSGIGIKAEDLGRLFTEFGQLDQIGKNYGGTGLGLALTKRIVERQGGKVEVTSQPGKGSVFTAYIPYVAGSEAGS